MPDTSPSARSYAVVETWFSWLCLLDLTNHSRFIRAVFFTKDSKTWEFSQPRLRQIFTASASLRRKLFTNNCSLPAIEQVWCFLVGIVFRLTRASLSLEVPTIFAAHSLPIGLTLRVIWNCSVGLILRTVGFYMIGVFFVQNCMRECEVTRDRHMTGHNITNTIFTSERQIRRIF